MIRSTTGVRLQDRLVTRQVRRRPVQREKGEQQGVVALLRSIGGLVYVIGRPSPNDGRRSRGTGQSPGLPDLYAHLPAPRGASDVAGRPVSVWIEVKATGGRLRPDQAEFRRRCEASSTPYVVGGVDAVVAWLIVGGWVKADNVPWYRRRPHTDEE